MIKNVYFFNVFTMDASLVLLAVGGFFALYAIFLYNSVVRAKNAVKEASGAIEAMFQNRYDLIPNLVEVVKKYAEHEKTTLSAVTEMRKGLMEGAHAFDAARLQGEAKLGMGLGSLFAVAENYPNLKADGSFLNLQNEWSEIENSIQAARRAYNSAVKSLLDLKETFPSNVVAGMMSIPEYAMFESATEAKVAPNAKELFK